MTQLSESRREYPRAELLARIFRYCKENISYKSDMTKVEFMDQYRQLMSALKFPMTVYRGLSIYGPDAPDPFFDARVDDVAAFAQDEYHSEDAQALLQFAQSINFDRIGTSWTWSHAAAQYGGALDSTGTCHVLVAAKAESRAVDWTMTLWQNLTVYEEEMEIRLLPHVPIRIVGLNPPVRRTPFTANTGPESWDDRASVINVINQLARIR